MSTNRANSHQKNTFVNYKLLVIPFLLGFLSAQKINFFGELYLGEIIFMGYLFSKFPRLNVPKQELSLLFFAMLWAGAQLISDIYNGTQLNDALKGIFAPIFFILTLLGLFNYFKNRPNRFPSFILGAAFGGLVHVLIFGNAYFEGNMWKWGLGGGLLSITLIYLSFFVRGPKKLLILLVVMGFAVISLNNSARGQALLPIISSILFIIFYRNKQYSVIRWLGRGVTSLKLLIVLVSSLILMNAAATALFSSDRFLENFSEDVASKYKTQASTKFGILLGGRSEPLVSVKAFLDKPLLGHGSWAMDKDFYYTNMKNELELELEFGYENINEVYSEIKLIPAHSYLMGAFLWAGILGGLFWLVLINKVLKIFILNINVWPVYFYTGVVSFFWNLLFSPFGASHRWSTALFLAVFLAYNHFLYSNQAIKD